jgi:serine/threonine protein kinase
MGCCQKKKQNQALTNKLNQNEADIEEDKDFTSISVQLTYHDFTPLKLLGRGSYGQVCLVRLKINNKLYAMKVLDKLLLKEKHQELHTKSERDLMVKVHCPFIVNIKSAFQDQKYLYIISDFMQGGDLYYHLHEKGVLNFEEAQFYISEIVLALEYLHKNNMIYRDLKPENILLDNKGHIKLTDFGLSKMLNSSNERSFTICGTIQYIAPEMFIKKGYDYMIDWWSLGCLMYEMFAGKFAFKIKRNTEINFDIYKQKLQFPRRMDEDAKDLINKLLVVEPKKRLGFGTNGVEKIKKHPFFEGINWDDVWNKNVMPPFVPELDDELDLRYFDKQFTDEPLESFTKNMRARETSYEYKNFTFVTDSIKNELMTIQEENKVENIKNDIE